MYSTHSDESYVPSDGESSKLENAGIYDVGEALAESFEERGIEVVYSKETFPSPRRRRLSPLAPHGGGVAQG